MGMSASASLWAGVSFGDKEIEIDKSVFWSALPPNLAKELEAGGFCFDGNYFDEIRYRNGQRAMGFGLIVAYDNPSKAIAPEQITEAIARTEKAWQQWGLSLEQFPVKVYLIADYS